MSDKPLAVITTAVILLPLVMLCCLGPALFGAALGGAIGWLAGLDLVYALGAAIATGLAIYSFMRRRRAHPHEPAPAGHTALRGEDDTDDTVKYPFASPYCLSAPSKRNGRCGNGDVARRAPSDVRNNLDLIAKV